MTDNVTTIHGDEGLPDDIYQRLWQAMTCSCTCNTKSPEPKYHYKMCTYRLFNDAADEIEKLRADDRQEEK